MVTIIPEFGLAQLVLTIIVMVVLITICIVLDYQKRKDDKVLVWSLAGILFISLTAMLVMSIIEIITVVPWFWSPDVTHEGAESSLHIGSILGLPALFLVTVGTVLLVFDEPKYVWWHGLLNGASWIITTTNVFLLLTLTPTQMIDYGGLFHSIHIFCGGIGLVFGLSSGLFGIAGQRRLAKMSGYVTLACWWTAYLLSTFILDI
jgi:hypothetical protein